MQLKFLKVMEGILLSKGMIHHSKFVSLSRSSQEGKMPVCFLAILGYWSFGERRDRCSAYGTGLHNLWSRVPRGRHTALAANQSIFAKIVICNFIQC